MSQKDFPAWMYGPNDAAEIFESADDIPAGWVDHPSKVKASKVEAKAAPKKPAEDPQTDDRPALRVEYKALAGKNAFGAWSADLLREKIATLKAAEPPAA